MGLSSIFFLFLLPHLVAPLSYHENGSLKSVPLKSLVVTGEFLDCLGEVTVKQTWVNDASIPITSNYKFSLNGEAVVSGLHMTIGEKSWVGVVKEKNQAQSQYNEAVAAGVKSSLLEKISDNDYQVQIGPIAPAESATIEFRYLTRVSVNKDGTYLFVLPTNIAPKYSPTTNNQADIEYARKMGTMTHVSQPGYAFEVDLTWRSGSALREIVSPTNAIRTEVLSPTAVRVQCSTAPENGDFSLLVRTAESTGAYLHQKADGTRYLYVHNQIPAETTAASAKTITVVLDRSGSMGGNKIVQAVRAVDEFLSLLQLQADASTLVNIVSFGSSYSALYSHPVRATAANIAQMRLRVKSFGADFGGTELLRCLSDVVKGQYSESETRTVPVASSGAREHVVVLLTDGEVDNVNSVIEMLEQKAKGVRIMTIGIGRDADRKLVQKVAEATYGISRVLVDELDLTAALRDVLGYIDKQYYTNVRLLGHEVSQVSRVLYPAHPVDMFLRLSAEQYAAVARDGLSVTATDPVRGGAKVWSIAVADCVAVGDLLEKLYANHIINELSRKIDANEGNRAEALSVIVRLSAAHGIMNKHTSFLIISDEKIRPDKLRDVRNVEVPHSSGESGFLSSGASFGGAGGHAMHKMAGAVHSPIPNAGPSAVPSCVPSAMPSAVPSAQPTAQPTFMPSSAPSAMPSSAPSAGPSCAPTCSPSAMPSAIPSVLPSVVPSVVPTAQPSSVPNAMPSAVPTVPTVHFHTKSAASGGLFDIAHDMLGDAKAGSVLLQPGQVLKVNAEMGTDGSTFSQAQTSSSTDMAIIRFLMAHPHGALPYDADSYLLLGYASAEALETDAARAGLRPGVFFNVVCLLRVRKYVSAAAQTPLEAFVSSKVVDLKVAEVAEMLGL